MINKVIYWWVEYIDDYNNKHLTPIKEKKDLIYIQNNYNIISIENTEEQVEFL